MLNLSNIYDIILSNLNDFEPQLTYLSVGCALGHYDKIAPNQNQQYPFPILNKYEGKKKVIILIDSQLETPLKIEEIIKLTLIEKSNIFRMLANEDTLVFAINSNYYFDNNSNSDIKIFELHFNFLKNLITYTICNDSKLIVQNFAGHCIQNSYVIMFDLFPEKKLLNQVIFDVSNSDGNCGFDFDKYPIQYDEKRNFIQTRFKNLVMQKKINPEYFNTLLIKRIDSINYSLTRKLRVIRGELESIPHENETIEIYLKTLSIIYPEINNIEINERILIHTMKVLINDICEALDIDKSIIATLTAVQFNQNEVINKLSILKQLI